MSNIPHLKPETVATLESFTPVQLRALSEFLFTFSSQSYAKELSVRPNVLATRGRFADDDDLKDDWRTFVHYVNLPDTVPQRDVYDSPYSIVKLR